MIRVIINADDLGKSPEVNSAIDVFLTKGLISSSTILANSDYWCEVKEIVKKHSEASFGVHLNMTEGRALTNSPILHKYGIVDNTNCFTKVIKGTRNFPVELQDAIYHEWSEQIKKITITEGISISHIDGHHHVHAIVGLTDVLIRLIQNYNIPAVRSAYRKPVGYFFSQRCRLFNPLVWKGYLKMMSWRKRIMKNATMVDYFDSYETACVDMKQGMKYPENSVVELMCHPGHPKYENENVLITREYVSNSNKKIILVNYSKLQ